MTLTAHPSHPTGQAVVRARILAATVCDPHGLVDAGQLVLVTVDEFWKLKHAGKAELVLEQVADTAPLPDTTTEANEDLFEKLDAMTKAELVAFGQEQYGLDLSERDKKDDLVSAIVMVAGSKAAE